MALSEMCWEMGFSASEIASSAFSNPPPKKYHPVVLYRNMHILRRKLRCDTAYFKPCNNMNIGD
jgi:hypothetical protein